jgi:hypothetical protein
MFCKVRLCGVLVLWSIQADNQQGDCALSNIRGANRLRDSPNNWRVRIRWNQAGIVRLATQCRRLFLEHQSLRRWYTPNIE